MKNTFILLVLCLSIFQLNAQVTVEVNPDPVDTAVDEMEVPLDVVGHSHITITDGGDASINWQISVVCAPPEWEFAVCDKNACYTTSIISRNMDLIAGEASTMDVHCYPNGATGYGKAEISFTLVNSPQDILYTATYSFQVNSDLDSCSALVGLDELLVEALQVYPNPVVDQFQLSTNDITDRIVLYDATGKAVKTFQYQANQTYSMQGLPDGIYMATLVNQEAGVLKTVRLVKQESR